MKPLNMRAYLLVTLAIVAGVQSGPLTIDTTECATRPCLESSGKFAYSVGSTYSYNYEADSVTSLQGASEEHSSLHIRATADIHVHSPCELSLTLREVTLEQSDPSDLNRRTLSENTRQFKRALEANPVKFSFHDGHIESVCAESQEESWVLNTKRAILSGLQNTMENLDQGHEGTETDVAGVCDVKYTVAKRGWGGSTSVTKSKDFSKCSDRHAHFSSMQATPYKVTSDFHSMPLLSGSHMCDQTISKEGIMMRSEVRESHRFRPFSNQDSGATTTTRQLLEFKSESRDRQNTNFRSLRHSDLLFDHSDAEQMRIQQGEEQVLSVLEEICQVSDVRPDTPRLYTRLVYALRKLDGPTLRNMHGRVESGNICQGSNNEMAKLFFNDAIPSVSTAASASLIREMIMSGEMSNKEADIWLTSLAFAAQPSSDMIGEISPLLQTPKPTKKMYLSISALINSFCRNNYEECRRDRNVLQFLNTISNNLGYNCAESDSDKVLMSLKALGNAGVHDESRPILARCMANSEISVETRRAAVEALRRMPCDERSELMSLFRNTEEDSELRIAAYLGVMQCPNEEVIRNVRDTLGSEEVNQVGSFVWTHLTNLKETADIFKQEIQDIVEDEELKKEFNMDARKFSRNYEGSMFLDSLNAGAKVESNLIWSPKSFVPRSAMLNLTVDMFGKSVNFLEVGGRVEGAEDFLQKMFGEDGYFPAETRQKRSVDRDQKLNELNRADPKASMYLKIFGNELQYWDFMNLDSVEREDFNILDLLIKLAQEHEVEWSRSAMFLDSEISVPTALGMPLKLNVKGSATVDLKMGGHFDVRQLAVYPNSMDINGYFKPSGAVEISSVMGLDAFVAQTGLKMVSTLHTSTEVDALIKLDESRAITAKFNMPKDKIEILNVQTDFYIVHKGEERKQAMLTDNRVTMSKCSCDKTANALGVRLCAELSYPASNKADAPYFPFTGPVSASVELLKTDDHDSYEFEAYLKTEKENGALNRYARLSFDTPKSKVNRKIFADVEIDSGNQRVSAKLNTPWKEATIDGSVVNKKELKSARFEMTIDQKPAMALVSELQIDARPKATKISPNVQLRIRNKPIVSLTGDAKYVAGEKIDGDMTLDSTLMSAPITLKGGVESVGNKAKSRWNTDVILKSPFINTKISGFTQTKDGLISSRTEFNYNWNDGSKHEFVVNSKVKDLSKAKLSKYSINTAVTSSEFPDYNVEMDLDLMKNPKHMETTLDLHYGADSKDMKKRILINQELDITGNVKNLDVNHVGKLKWKAMDIDMQSKLSHTHSLYESLKTNGKFSYRPNKDISLNVALQKDKAPLTKMSGDVMFEYPGREMRFSKNIEQKSADEFSHTMLFQWQKGGQVRTNTVYTRMPSEKRHEFTSELYGPVGKPTVVTGSAVLKLDDFNGKVQVAHKGDIYQAESKYDYDLTGAKKSLNANVDVIIPSRHITADTAITSAKGQHSINVKSAWDVDNDASQRFNLNGIVSAKQGSHEGDLKVVIPSRTVSLSFNNKFDKEKFNSRADLTWAPQKSISVVSSGAFAITSYSQSVQGSIEVATPFIEQVTVNVNHRFNKRLLENQVDVSYGGEKKVSTDISSQMEDGLMAMNNKLVITTPVQAIRRLRIEESHKLAQNAFTGHLEGALNDKEMGLDMDGKINGNTVSASASMQTPFPAIRKASGSWEHTFNGQSLTAHAEGSLNRQSVVADLTNTFTGSQLNNKITIQTSFNKLRNAEMETSYTYRGQSLNGAFTLNRNNAQVFALAGELNYNQDVEGKLQLQSQFNNMEDLSTMFFVKKSQTPMLAHADFKWAPNKVVAIDGEFSQNKKTKMEVRFTSPFAAAERLVLSHEHALTNGWESTTEFEYAPKKTVQLTTSLNMNSGIAASMKLDTACPYLRSFETSLNHAGYGTNFNNKFSLNLQSYATFTIEHYLTMRGVTYIKGNTQLSSSYDTIEVSIDSQDVDGEMVSKLDVNLPRREKVSLETRYQNRGEMKASAEVTTTFTQLPSASVSVSHRGQGAYFANKIIIDSHIMRQAVKFESNININGVESQDISLQLTSPFENLEDVAFVLRHSFDGENMNCHTEMQLDSRSAIIADNKLSFGRTFSINTDIKTPFRSFRSLVIDAEHTGYLARFNNKGSFKMVTVDGATEFSSGLRVNGLRLINGQMSFSSPYKSAEMNLKHGLKGAAWMTDFDLTLPSSERIELNSNINTEDLSANILLKTPFTHDISFVASRAIQSGTIFGKATFSYAPYKTIEAEVRYANGQTFLVGGTLRTPCPYMRQVEASVEHTGPWNNFINKMAFALDDTSISTESTFNFDFKDMEAKLIVDGSLVDRTELTVSHDEKTSGRYECSASVSSKGKEIITTASIDVRNMEKLNLEFGLNTPFWQVRRANLKVEHNGDLNAFNNKVEFSLNGQKSVYEGEFNNGRKIAGDFKLVTPYPRFEQIQVTFESRGMNYNEMSVVYAPGKKVEAKSTISMNNGFEAELNFNAPFCAPVAASVTCAPNSHTMAASYGNQKATLEAEWSWNNAKVSVTSPFDALRNAEWTISGTGSDIGDFSIETSAKHNGRKAFDFSGEFFARDEIRAKAQWVSRFTNPLSLEFNHEGDYENFKTNGMFSYSPNKKMSASLDMKLKPSIEVHFNMDTPFAYLESLNVNAAHSGRLDNFKTTGDLSYNGEKLADMEVTFSMDRFNVEGAIKVDSVVMNLNTDFHHKSNRKLVSSDATFILNGERFSGQTKIILSPEVDVSFDLETPYEIARSVSIQLKAADDENTMSSSLVVKGNSFGKIKTDGSIQRSPLEVNMNVQTPSNYMRDVSFNLKHRGNIANFQNELKLTHNRYGEMTYSGSFSANPINGVFEVTTPYPKVQQLKVTFDHEQKARRYLSNAMVSVNGEEYKVATDLTPTESSITVETPYQQARNVKVEVNSNNNLRAYEGSLNVVRNGRSFISSELKWETQGKLAASFEVKTSAEEVKVEVNSNYNLRAYEASLNVVRNGKSFISSELKWETQGKIDASFELTTSFVEVRNLRANIRHNGSVRRFNNYIELTFNGETLIQGESSFSMSPLTGNFEVKVPFVAPVRGEFSHEGSASQFRSHAELTYNTHSQFMADASFQMKPKIEANFQIATPFNVLESASLTINHQGSLQNFQSSAEMTLNNRDKYGAQVSFTLNPEIDGSISIATPIHGFRNINAGFHFGGNSQAFNGNANLSADESNFAVDGSFQMRPLNGKLSVQTPIAQYEDLSAEFSHKGNMRNGFASQALVAYQTGKKIEAGVDIDISRRKGSLTLKTPFEGYEDMGVRAKHAAESNGLSSSVDASLGNSKVSADLALSMSPHFEAKLDLNTPIRGFKRIAIIGSHKTTRNGIESNGQIAFAGKSFDASVKGQFNSLDDMNGEITIQTPFRKFSTMRVAGSHQTVPSIKTDFEASINEQKVHAAFDMANSNNLEAGFTLNTPFAGFEEVTAKINHEGSLRKFTTKLTAQYGAGKEIVALTTFDSTSDLEGLFQLTCPCQYIRNIGAQFNFRGQFANFEASGKLFKESREITLNTVYSSSYGIPTMLKTEVTNPWTDNVVIELNNNYRRNGKFETTGSLQWSPRQQVVVSADGVLRGKIADLLLNGNLEITTPFRAFNHMQVTTQHQHNVDAINNKLNVDFNRRNVLDTELVYGGANSKVEMKTPYNVAAQIDTTGSLNDLSSDVELKWEGNNNIRFQITHKDQSSSSSIDRAVSIRTITASRTMSLSTSVMKNAYTFSHDAAFSWDEARDKTVSYKVDFNDRSRRYNHIYALEARLDTPIRSAELIMNHNDDSATYNSEATFKWDAARDASKKVSVSNKYSKSGNSHDDVITISHPALEKAFTMHNKFAVNEGKVLFNGQSEIDFLSSPVMVSLTVEDKASSYGAINYTVDFACSHPGSTVDIQAIAHVANSRAAMSSGINVNYLTARRQQKNLGLMAQINKLKKSMNLVMNTPMKSAEISGDLTAISGGYALNMAAESEGKSVNARVETGDNEFDMKLFYSPANPDNMLHVSGKYLSATDMMLEAYRNHNGKRVTEATINIELEKGHLFKTNIYWRPNMFADLKDKIGESRVVRRSVSRFMDEAADAINMEARYKKQLISAAAPDMSPLIASMSEEMASFQRDGQMMSRAFNQMYYRNEFYMKSIDEAAERFAAAAVQSMKETAYAAQIAAHAAAQQMAQKWEEFVFQARLQSFKVIAYVNRYLESFIETSYQVLDAAKVRAQDAMVIAIEVSADYLRNATIKFSAYWEKAVARGLEVAERVLIASKPVMELCVDIYERLSAAYERFAAYSSEKMAALQKKVPMVYLNKKWTQLKVAISGVDVLTPVSNVQVSVRDNVKSMVSQMNDAVTKMARKSTRELSARMAILNARLQDFLEHDDTKYAHQLVQEAYTQVKSAFEYLEVQKRVGELIKNSADSLVRLVRKNAFYMVDDYLKLDQDKLITYNPREGKIEFQMWIPMALPEVQLSSIPDTQVLREMYFKGQEIATGLIPQNFNPMDLYYQYKPKTDALLPPFDAYAMISGSQHYMTFDKKFFEFAGSCSYTLAREFVDQTFEVLVNYEDDREIKRKSISVRTEGKEVEIASKGVVSVDGVQTELPVEFNDVQITREGHVIQLISKKGFTVHCDVANDVCKLQISGWYYNKVAGLFGTYTNEKVDDLMTADGSLAQSIEDFTHSWVVGRCRSIENRARVWDSDTKHTCQKLFDSQESLFSRCFKVVSPAPFKKMCINDVLEDVTNKGDESSACKAAAMYVMTCKAEGVPLRLPRSCVACNKPSYDTYKEGEELTAYAADQSADVILVVEEKPCNKDAFAKLGDIADDIDVALKAKALKNNQFGVIGFGGAGIHDEEHVQTVGGKMLGSAAELRQAVESMDATMVGQNTDVFKALRMAVKYPFRAGVAKSIVLLTCSECTEQAARYNEIAYNLRSRGISLHVIMNHEFMLGPHDIETPKTNYLFGIDKKTAFTKSHVTDADLSGDEELFALLEKPSSECARLAQETDGSYFSLDKLTTGRVKFQKAFIDVFSRRVAKSAAVPACQVCECVSDANGAPTSVCKPCNGDAGKMIDGLSGLPPVPAQYYHAAGQQPALEYEEA